MAVKTLNRSFAGGEISEQLFSRVDLDKYQTGVALLLNCWALPQGPIQNRPGFQYVQRAKFTDRAVRLLPFAFNTEQTFALEFGDRYIRFHTNGSTLLEDAAQIASISVAPVALFLATDPVFFAVGDSVFLGEVEGMPQLSNRWFFINTKPSLFAFTLADLNGTPVSTLGMGPYSGLTPVAKPYEVATPYEAALLPTLNVVQSADVLTIVSQFYAPAELRRFGPTDWRLADIVFSSSLAPPQSTGATPSAIGHAYTVIGVVPGTGITVPGGAATTSTTNDLSIPGRYNVVGWTPQAGAVAYYVYKLIAGDWYKIGEASSGNQFIDDGTQQPSATPGFPPDVPLLPALTASATAITPFSNGVSVIPTGGGATRYRYVVTSTSSATKEESLASGEAEAQNDLSINNNLNTVRWPAAPGVSEYNVYRYSNGLWGFVGSAGADCIFIDRNILPDTSITPPIQTSPFIGSGNFPRAVSYYEQRRVFGGSLNQPQVLWMTRSGTEKNLGYSIPNRDDDGITVRVVAREANTIRHIVPMNEMMLLTSGGEWKVAASDSGALTPANISVKPQGYTGSSVVPPVVTSRTILFPQDRGGHIRELQFSWEQQGYQTTDVSILAPHLFDYHTVVQLCFSRSPVPMLWSVREDGRLLGMTYVPEHEVRAWSQHETDGVFESCCAVAEGAEDVLYVVVRRVVAGTARRYVERLHTRRFDTAADQFFVDSGLTYRGAPVSEVGGLHHLEGKTVAILADGGVSPSQVVTNGRVAIEAPASVIHVGLPYRARVQTLPLSMQTQAFGQGLQKNISKVSLRVLRSNAVKAGPAFDKLRSYRSRATEPFGSAPDLLSEEIEITVDPSWNRNGQLCIEQAEPLSMMVLGMVLEVATGG